MIYHGFFNKMVNVDCEMCLHAFNYKIYPKNV